VVLLDYHLPPSDGLLLCRRIKATMPPPGVLMFSAYASAQLAVPALLAGADGLVNKAAPAIELYDAVRMASRGERVMPPLDPDLLSSALRGLDDSDRAIVAMVLDGTPPSDVAQTLGLGPEAVNGRIDDIIGRLAVDVPLAPRA
jgi:DNA-binding NarL/FixJ family response regulator